MNLQPRYAECFVCGDRNPSGLNLSFWDDGEKVYTEFTPDERHQGYPGLLHGGILYTVLDEVIGRAAFLKNEWVLSGRMEIRYLKPAVIGETIRFFGVILNERSRLMELAGEARLVDGTVIARAKGQFMKITDEIRRRAEGVLQFGAREPAPEPGL